jgi:outer membrane protein assembly factor BamA
MGAGLLALFLGLLPVRAWGAEPEAPVVKSIRIEGNGGAWSGTSDFNILTAMQQGKNPPLTWWLKPRLRRAHLDAQVLGLDSWRIENWYAHRGYFDARVTGWDVQSAGSARRFLFWHTPAAVQLVATIDEGQQSTVRSMTWMDMGRMGRPIQAHLRRKAPLKSGAAFDLEDLLETEAISLEIVHERSFARAELTAGVEAHPEAHAVDVEFTGSLGPPCTFGPVHLPDGLALPTALVEAHIEVVPGQPYRASKLSQTQQQLFGLGVFSMVNLVPDLSASEGESIIPITVELTEGKARQLKAGAGFSLESGRSDVHMGAEFGHTNVANRLIRSTLRGQAGYVSNLTGSAQGPTALAAFDVLIPRFAPPRLGISLDAQFEMGVEEGFRYASPTVAPGVRWSPTDDLTLALSWRLKHFRYLELTLDQRDLVDTPLGLDATGEDYLLSSVSHQLVFDARDDVLFTRRGLYTRVDLTGAGGLLGGQYNFLRAQVDQRGYVPVISILGTPVRGTVAGRIGGGIIGLYGAPERAKVPYAERLYLGGSDVRGWVHNHLGPQLHENDDGDLALGQPGEPQASTDGTPIGGMVSASGGLEYRHYADSGIGFALFTDLGMVWESLEHVNPRSLQPSVGAGTRYESDIGPIRLDVAIRLGDAPQFSLEPRVWVHLGLAEAY